jgi:putative PIN family toxin of toxin-antitoxin system
VPRKAFRAVDRIGKNDYFGVVDNTKIKVVLDTNVLYSGLKSRNSAAFSLLSLLPERVFTFCISVPLVLEYEMVLRKYAPELNLEEQEVQEVLNVLCALGEETRIFYLWRPFMKDPFDDHVVELALASRSRYIITFNIKDFAGIEKLGIEAITPGHFLEKLEQQ